MNTHIHTDRDNLIKIFLSSFKDEKFSKLLWRLSMFPSAGGGKSE